jgi:hypothetical protein
MSVNDGSSAIDSNTLDKLLNTLNQTNELNKSVFNSFLKTQHDFKTEDELLQSKLNKANEANKEYQDYKTKTTADNLTTLIVNSKNSSNAQLAGNCAEISSLLIKPTIDSIKETVSSLEDDQNTSSLNTHYLENLSKDVIASQVKAIPNYEDLKLNIELTFYVTKIVLKLLNKKNINVSFQDFTVKILHSIFVLNAFEEKLIYGQIKFLGDNKLLEKKKKFSFI